MRSWKKRLNRGFTLVELMIVVAIIGVLAALAIYGVNRYLKSSKTSEAKNTIGAIARGGQAAFEREQAAPELLAAGNVGATLNHDLCATSTVSIAAVPAGTKNQPDPTTFEDTVAGVNDPNAGWLCLRFGQTSPTYYQYGYTAVPIANAAAGGGAAVPVNLIAQIAMPANGFYAHAQGDLDGDLANSEFGVVAEVDLASRTLKTSTQVILFDELE